jgi:hypothetical protein
MAQNRVVLKSFISRYSEITKLLNAIKLSDRRLSSSNAPTIAGECHRLVPCRKTTDAVFHVGPLAANTPEQTNT